MCDRHCDRKLQVLRNCLGENAKFGNVKELALELKESMKVE